MPPCLLAGDKIFDNILAITVIYHAYFKLLYIYMTFNHLNPWVDLFKIGPNHQKDVKFIIQVKSPGDKNYQM